MAGVDDDLEGLMAQGIADDNTGMPDEDQLLDDDDNAPVETLVPLCARGPNMNTAVYGYDIEKMREKPWAKPGANPADYFNYGFDEASYRAYCAMQTQGSKSVVLKADTYVKQQFGQDASAVGVPAQADVQRGPVGDLRPGRFDRDMRPPRGAERLPNKTKPCFAFRSGMCNKGDRCIYAHGDEEMMAARNAAGSTTAQPDQWSAPRHAGGYHGAPMQPRPQHADYQQPGDGGPVQVPVMPQGVHPPQQRHNQQSTLEAAPPGGVLAPPANVGAVLSSASAAPGGFRMPKRDRSQERGGHDAV